MLGKVEFRRCVGVRAYFACAFLIGFPSFSAERREDPGKRKHDWVLFGTTSTNLVFLFLCLLFFEVAAKPDRRHCTWAARQERERMLKLGEETVGPINDFYETVQSNRALRDHVSSRFVVGVTCWKL